MALSLCFVIESIFYHFIFFRRFKYPDGSCMCRKRDMLLQKNGVCQGSAFKRTFLEGGTTQPCHCKWCLTCIWFFCDLWDVTCETSFVTCYVGTFVAFYVCDEMVEMDEMLLFCMWDVVCDILCHVVVKYIHYVCNVVNNENETTL